MSQERLIAESLMNLAKGIEHIHHRLSVLEKAERSEVLQGCPPSATGSADARAAAEAGADSSGRSAEAERPPRICTRCPACRNGTLTINKGHLLCTWHECPDPTLIDRLGEPERPAALAVQRERVLQPNS